MPISVLQVLLALIAAFVAGMMNSIAGGGILIIFSVLIWLGLDPKAATATSAVVLWPGLIGSVIGYRFEIHDSRILLLYLSIPSVIGGTLGGALLIATPTKAFAQLVPYLIIFATAVFMMQTSLKRYLTGPIVGERFGARWWLYAILFQSAASVYGAYFGAGNGILILAALALMGISDIHKANGIKSFLCFCMNGAAVILFALSGLVHWNYSLIMAAAALAGGYATAKKVLRCEPILVRRSVVIIGLVTSFILLCQTLTW